MDKSKKERVLFLCTGNSCRSQMAEALLRKHAGDRFEVFSAGLEPGTVHPLTIEVLEEIGIDVSAHSSKSLDVYKGKVDFDYLITVCNSADEKCPMFPGMGVRLHWPFEDPANFKGIEEEKIKKFREVREQINSKILGWI